MFQPFVVPGGVSFVMAIVMAIVMATVMAIIFTVMTAEVAAMALAPVVDLINMQKYSNLDYVLCFSGPSDRGLKLVRSCGPDRSGH